jgi:hypothetical protein
LAALDAGLPERLVAVCREQERTAINVVVLTTLPKVVDASDHVPYTAPLPESRKGYRL